MNDKPFTKPLTSPVTTVAVTNDSVSSGLPIPAIDRIKIFSDLQWEEFILEWADSLKDQYAEVERCGGAGDMGRDIVGVRREDSTSWDNYQCKHYKSPLAPTDIWIELGKLVFYTHRGDYTYPRQYFFVAPQGAGTKLSNFFRNAEQLRSGLIDHWNSHCRLKILSREEIDLTDELLSYVNGLDFSIFSAVPPLRIIDQHAKTRWHVARFGGGLPPRLPATMPPDEPADHEVVYVQQLLGAYGEYLQQEVRYPGDIANNENLIGHFEDSRREFYSAESLRLFSRDTLPPGEFDKLQNEVHDAIRDDVRSTQPDGFHRVMAVVRTARLLPLSGHSLHSRISTRDRGGMCHQLANERKVRWTSG